MTTDSLGAGRYAVRVGNEVRRFTHWDDIPESFDNLIEWIPDIPPEPHTQAEHEWIEGLPDKFRKALAKERRNAGRDTNR